MLMGYIRYSAMILLHLCMHANYGYMAIIIVVDVVTNYFGNLY